MKETSLLKALQSGAKRIRIGPGFAFAVTFLCFNAPAQDVNLGTANNFAVLAGSTVTVTDPTVINGDIGLYSGTSITGLGNVTLNGTVHQTDAIAQTAKADLTTAYNTAAGLTPTMNLTGQNLGGLTLTPGVYFFSSSAQLTGTLTLNDLGNPDAVFVFQIGSTLTTASDSSVVTINGGATPGISTFWQVGSSATLGTDTAFEGNILALTSITLDTTASDLDGRVLAMNGAVTLDNNDITAPPAETIVVGGSVPDTGSTLLMLGSISVLFLFGRRFSPLLRPAV
jgi:type VI secretion system secreted protein VgrG